MTWAPTSTEPIVGRIDAIAAAHGPALERDAAARRVLAGLRAVVRALGSDSPPAAEALIDRARGWLDSLELALAGAGPSSRADGRAAERVFDVQRQLDDHLAEVLPRAAPAWRAAWLARLAPASADTAIATRDAPCEAARERARWILDTVLDRACLAPWGPSLELAAPELAGGGSLELFARTTVGDRAGELVRARIAPSLDGAATEASDALGYAVTIATPHRGRTLAGWLATGPTDEERVHLAYSLVEDALGRSSPGHAAAAPNDDSLAPDPAAIRVGGVPGSPVPAGDPGARQATWDAWSGMLDALDVAQARFEDLPANLEPLADRLAAEIAATPRWQLGRLGERSAQVRAWFTRLAAALGDLEEGARAQGWPLGRRAGRVDSGALDVAMGDPDDVAAQRRTIALELIPFFARPYQVALMGVFSSGKTLLINKLLLAMAGLPLAPYSPDPPYRRDPRYAALKPYLRRSTAEPTDTVVTILRAPRADDDPGRTKELLALIAKPRPTWPSDPVELPVPLAELETMNLVDTPGLNEDLSVNRRVGAFLQSCDLIVYVFSATGVMNSQDHFLIRRLHEVAPGKRMVFAINMIDTLVNRVEHTAFWHGDHEKAVVKASLPLRTRIKHEVARLTGVEPALVSGEDFWVTSGAYDYQVEGLYRHLRSLIERTAALDRLRATPGMMRTHLRWARDFARVHLERELRPRRTLIGRALDVVRSLFERELPRRMDEDKEQALVQFARRHALADPVFPSGPRVSATDAVPDDPPAPWAAMRGVDRLAIGSDHEIGAGALARALEDLDAARIWASDFAARTLTRAGRDGLEREVGRFERELAPAVGAARGAIDGAFAAFADALLPARVEAAGTALGREIERRCAALAVELTAEYRRRWSVDFGAPGTPEEPAARALVGAPGTTGTEPASDPLEPPRRALAARVDAIAAELGELSRFLALELDRAPARLAERLADAIDRLRDGGSVRTAIDQALARRLADGVLRQRARIAGIVAGAVLVTAALVVGGGAGIALVAVAAGGGVGGWWWDRGRTRAQGESAVEDEARLARAWLARSTAFDRDVAACKAELDGVVAGWVSMAHRLDEVTRARGSELESDYRASVRELFRSGTLAPWLASIHALARARIAPLEALRERLDRAIGAAESAQIAFAVGELADEAAAHDVLARAHDRDARARPTSGRQSGEV